MDGSWWVIDGNNVMGARPDGWWRDRRGAADRLVEELAVHPWARNDSVVVFFDGPGETCRAGRVTVVHTGHASADDAVIEHLSGAPPGRAAATTLVTSDRALADRCRPLVAEITGSGAFRTRLSRSRPV